MIRPLGDWLLVRLDPIAERSDVIVTMLSDAVRIRTAEVLRSGPGRYASPRGRERVPMGVSPGDRVAFFRENFEHRPGKALTYALSELGDDLGMLRVSDVLFVLSPGEKVKVG